MSLMMLGWMPSVGSSRISSFGPRRQRAGDGQLLLLAAGEIAAAAVDHLLEHREQLEQLGRHRRAAGLVGQAHAQVLVHRQPAEDLAALRHVAHALAHALVGRVLVERVAVERDAAGADGDHAHQALQQRGLAHAVAAQDHRHLAGLRLEADVAQDVRAAVVLVDAFDAEHLSARGTPRRPCRWPAPRPACLRPARCLRAARSPSCWPCLRSARR